MIKTRTQVEMVTYENELLTRLAVERKDFYPSIADEISTDLMWTQANDVIKLVRNGEFYIIPIKRSIEELIEIIEDTISEYELEEYL